MKFCKLKSQNNIKHAINCTLQNTDTALQLGPSKTKVAASNGSLNIIKEIPINETAFVSAHQNLKGTLLILHKNAVYDIIDINKKKDFTPSSKIVYCLFIYFSLKSIESTGTLSFI